MYEIDIMTLFDLTVGDMMNESVLGRAQERDILRIAYSTAKLRFLRVQIPPPTATSRTTSTLRTIICLILFMIGLVK